MAAAILPIISGLAGLFGGLSPKSTTQDTSSTTNSSQTGTQTGTTTPNLSPLQQALIGLFTQGAADTYKQSQNLTPYTAQGLEQIEGQGSANRQTLNNILSSRGLSFSPAAATALTQNALNTGNQQSQFVNQVPLLQRQLQQQSLQQLIQAFGVIPTGVTSTGTSSQTGQSSTTGKTQVDQYGNPVAGALTGVGAALPIAFPKIFPGGK